MQDQCWIMHNIQLFGNRKISEVAERLGTDLAKSFTLCTVAGSFFSTNAHKFFWSVTISNMETVNFLLIPAISETYVPSLLLMTPVFSRKRNKEGVPYIFFLSVGTPGNQFQTWYQELVLALSSSDAHIKQWPQKTLCLPL